MEIGRVCDQCAMIRKKPPSQLVTGHILYVFIRKQFKNDKFVVKYMV